MIKRIFFRFFLIFLSVSTVGCEEIGYIVTIKTNHIEYENLKQIQRILEYKGFKTMVMERKKDRLGLHEEVYTVLEKRLGDRHFYVVDIDLNYVRDLPNNFVHDFRIDVSNVYKGMTNTELKDEIDKIGDLVYEELVDKLGNKNVVIERKEIHNRLVFFR